MSGSAHRLWRRGERRRQSWPPAAPLRGNKVLVQLHVHAGVERYIIIKIGKNAKNSWESKPNAS